MGSIWLRVADKSILVPTQHEVDPGTKERQVIPFGTEQIEAWVQSSECFDSCKALAALKFPGAGGRAERGGPHPCELMSDEFVVWTVNPPGYGGSGGRASLANIGPTADYSYQAFCKVHGGRQTIVVGNSIGCLYALHVASRHPVDGVYLRNPPPLRQLIMGRHTWWNLGMVSRRLCRHLPDDIDALANAAKSAAPLLMITCEDDRVVPKAYQQLIYDAYAGPKTQFLIPGADHHETFNEDQQGDYDRSLGEFSHRVTS